MTDSEKPFACPSPGCNMSFINEDHLTVHKKKHDMVLNLGANGKGNVFVADQTPTPTRFIRNCEEVGLFQDLQNVNPFEETFRRAVEASKTGVLAVSEIGISDDTLHTPHIFPHIADVQTTNSRVSPQTGVQETSTNASENHVKNTAITVCSSTVSKTVSRNDRKNVKIIATTKETKNTSETIIVQEADTSNSSSNTEQSPLPQLCINGEEVQLLLKTSDGRLMQLSAVQVSENQSISADPASQPKKQMVVIKTEPLLSCAEKKTAKNFVASEMSVTKMKLKQVLTKNSAKISKNEKESMKEGSTATTTRTRITPSRNNKDRNEDRGKKQEILERNRASSMRSRAKRKVWIQQMQRTVDNVNDANAALQLEVRALRAEVAKLKTLLLAHKDCPVTKAMEKGNGIILGPKVISVNSELVRASPDMTTSPPKRTAMSPVPIVPKKKIMKIPVILPKSDNNAAPSLQNAKIVRNLSTVKIVNVREILAGKDFGKQIIVMQNRTGKNGGDQSQIIQINSNFDVDNAASKSTGT